MIGLKFDLYRLLRSWDNESHVHYFNSLPVIYTSNAHQMHNMLTLVQTPLYLFDLSIS